MGTVVDGYRSMLLVRFDNGMVCNVGVYPPTNELYQVNGEYPELPVNVRRMMNTQDCVSPSAALELTESSDITSGTIPIMVMAAMLPIFVISYIVYRRVLCKRRARDDDKPQV